ncbi:MAG: ABC transporter permease subunit [Treponema sp.]|jgi:putative aldouronate transport system permease protein|nr:ABC transporter permease subunit [Treponema sp.]
MIRRNSFLGLFWKQRYLQVFALAGIVFLVIFSYLPMFGILIAFKEYKISGGLKGILFSPWVGLKYFREFFSDYNAGVIIRNTVVMSIVKLFFTFPLPILLALLLNEIHVPWFKRAVQTASYLPYFISWVIVAGFCQIFLQANGVINSLLMALGLTDGNIAFYVTPKYFLPMVVITSIWKDMGWWAILFLASITSIDPTLYEAAAIDGAGRLKRILYITLPGIQSTITVVLIIALGNLLGGGLSGSNFEQSWLMGTGGNAEVSEILQTYLMKIGLSKGRYSYAAAMGLIQSCFSVILVLTSNQAAKRVSGEGLF